MACRTNEVPRDGIPAPRKGYRMQARYLLETGCDSGNAEQVSTGKRRECGIQLIRERLETGGLAVQIESGVGNSKSRGCKVQDAKRRGGVGALRKRICACAKDDGSTVHTLQQEQKAKW